jgi:hypothetical protein
VVLTDHFRQGLLAQMDRACRGGLIDAEHNAELIALGYMADLSGRLPKKRDSSNAF